MTDTMQQCILSFNNRAEVLELPVPLQEWNLEAPHNTYRFTTLESGEVLAIGAKKLEEMTIESFFPATKDYTFLYSKEFPEPWVCVEMIRRWKNSKKPIRVIIVGTDINHAMAIDEFEYGKADNTSDVHFTLKLSEYTFLNMPRSKRTSDEDLSERPYDKEKGGVHKVVEGDTLWDLAAKHLGNGNEWEKIAKFNDNITPKDLKPGMMIKLPGTKDKVMTG